MLARARWVIALLVTCAALAAAAAAHASKPVHWVGTWAASTQPDSKQTLADQTIRDVVHVSTGGRRVSLRVTNAYGANPLAAGDAFGDSGRLLVTKVEAGLAMP